MLKAALQELVTEQKVTLDPLAEDFIFLTLFDIRTYMGAGHDTCNGQPGLPGKIDSIKQQVYMWRTLVNQVFILVHRLLLSE